VRTTRFWNNHHQIRSKSKDWKTKQFNVLGAIKQQHVSVDSKYINVLEAIKQQHVSVNSK
jgi:hypothetical protein